jgi:lipid-binding SYLF domain-containing protein
MHAELLSYSRSRGIFAGISLEGSTLRPDDEAIKELYQPPVTNKEILMGHVKTPAAAGKVEALLDKNSSRRS